MFASTATMSARAAAVPVAFQVTPPSTVRMTVLGPESDDSVAVVSRTANPTSASTKYSFPLQDVPVAEDSTPAGMVRTVDCQVDPPSEVRNTVNW